jgi:hypothetical protein
VKFELKQSDKWRPISMTPEADAVVASFKLVLHVT